MADISKLRPRSRLGAPPPMTEASPNLEAPEIAPAAAPEPPRAVVRAAKPAATPAPAARAAPAQQAGGAGEEDDELLDGRSARRTGRTIQFATRVSPEFNGRVRRIAKAEKILLVEVLERALEAYEASRRGR